MSFASLATAAGERYVFRPELGVVFHVSDPILGSKIQE